MKLNWGAGVVIVFMVFVVAVLGVVGYAMSRRVDLVTDGYYEKGIAYQQQIDRIERARREGATVAMDVLPEGLMLRFSGTDARGEVLAYRPDDRARDFTLPVGLDSTGRMLIPKGRLAPGMWRIKVNWSMGGKEFYHEQKVSVQ